MKIFWLSDNFALSCSIDDYNELDKHGVDIVINCRAEQHDDIFELSNRGIAYYYIPVPDGMPPGFTQIDTFLKIMDLHFAKKKILIHCALGRGRSAMLATVWIVRQGMNLENALEYLKQVKEDVSLTKIQREKLMSWHNKRQEKKFKMYGKTSKDNEIKIQSDAMEIWSVCPFCNRKHKTYMPYGWMFYHRTCTRYVKALNKTNLICAEVGVREAENAKSMLNGLDIKKLYLVDPYVSYESEGGVNVQEEIDKWKKKAYEVMKPFGDKVEFVEKTSEDAASQFPDNHFDHVYIDASHLYPDVKLDIEVWWPKVKKDGIIGGHDYDEAHPGVVRAVGEFADMHPELKIKHFPPDWYYVRKNG